MIQLINISDFSQYKALSANINAPKKLDAFILEAQQFDLKKLLGDELYLDFIKDASTMPAFQKYSDLWSGSEFVYHTHTIRHEGLKPALIYLSYARYVLNSNVESTAFGTVNKITPESQHVDEKTISRLYNQAYAGAMDYWTDTKKYLDVSTFPLWHKFYNHKKIHSTRVAGTEAHDNTIHYLNYRRYGRRRWDDAY